MFRGLSRVILPGFKGVYMQNLELSNDDLVLLIKSLHDPIDRLKNTHNGYQDQSWYDNQLIPKVNRLIEIRKTFINELLSRCKASGLDL